VMIKHIARYICFKRTDFSFTKIGAVVGGNKNKAVSYSIKTIEGLIKPLSNGKIQDERLRDQIEFLIKWI